MLRRYLLLLLMAAPLLSLAQDKPLLSTFNWRRALDYLPGSERHNAQIFVPQKTSVTLDGKKKYAVTLPFIIEHAARIELQAVFSLPDSIPAGHFYFYSSGMSQTAAITVNNYALGIQLNDLTPAKIPIPREVLHPGEENIVTLRLKNPKELNEGFPRLPFLFTEKDFCGILRPFFLINQQPSIITRFTVVAQAEKNQFRFNLNLPGAENDFFIEVRISEPQSGKVLYKRLRRVPPGHRQLTDQFKVPAAYFWNADNPVLLQARVVITQNKRVLEEQTFSFGLRSLTARRNRLLLNGQATAIKGINYHLNPQRWQNKTLEDLLRTDLTFIKNNGFNAVRLPHYVPGERFLQLSDSLGLLVFAELPVWRYPEAFFMEDAFLENAKSTLQRMQLYLGRHPSLVAVGLGQQIAMSSGPAQKFMFILRQLADNNMDILTYISPIPEGGLPVDKVSDFYMLDVYKALNKTYFENPAFFTQMSLYGKLGFFTNPDYYDWQNPSLPLIRQKLWSREWHTVQEIPSLQGGFFESFQDWQMNRPVDFTLNLPHPDILPTGIYTFAHIPHPGASAYGQIWEASFPQNLTPQAHTKKSNFFAILLFFSAVIFFVFYRSRPRMRDNFNRALRHPYGFYVDLRERRIIPMFNSFLVGGFAALIMAVHLSSLLYFFRQSLQMQEAAAFILRPLNVFEEFLRLNANPFKMTLFLFLILLIFPFLFSLVIKIIGVFSRNKIRFRQIMAIALWAGLPLIFMLPFTFVNYHVLFSLPSASWSLYVFLFFIIWTHFRIINGIRVLFITRLSKVFSYMLLSYIIPLLILLALLKPVVNGLDYLQLILHAGALF